MKTFILAALILITTNAFAQKEQAFFCKDSGSIKNIANLVIETTKNKYHFEKVISGRDNVEFWYRHDPHTLIRIHFQVFPDTSARPFILKGLTGNFDDIFPFWKKYFQKDADSAIIEKAGAVKSSALSFSKGEIVYRFHKGGTIWQIIPYSLVDQLKNKTNTHEDDNSRYRPIRRQF